ncbi:hypothetical protein HII31_05349 [Pseudocercospora fuligena]|uniref:Uncharacterized protein n=1 Tax=Pseudocercospora fuligena TaxID=685502 RepID=A0A8H6VNQ6_9PEZI|nr:hypothetical protein HII31_05349 [Pseudocercospora fuligena]
MKSFVLAAALSGLAAAQQSLDAAAVAAAPYSGATQAPVGAANQGNVGFQPNPSSVSAGVQPTSAPQGSSKMMKRAGGDCSKQPAGTAPNTYPDTPQAFQANPYFHGQANSYPQIIPSGNTFYYEKFRDLNGSTQQNSYLTYYILNNYDVPACAAKCNSVDLCTAFNIYVERDPSLDAGPACPNPPSVSNYKCALWGSSISRETATNTGQYRDQFQVVITASNGYDKTNWTIPSPVDSFTQAANLSGKAITLAKNSYYLGAEYFPGPYDPQLCGYYATAQTAANRADAKAKGLSTYQPCNLFNAYTVYKNKAAQGTYCSLFNKVVGAEAAGAAGTYYNGDLYEVGVSYTYKLTQQDAGTL